MSDFENDGYEVVRNVLSTETCQILSLEFQSFAAISKMFSPNQNFGDEQVEKCFSKYAHTPFDALLEYLKPKIETIVGKKLYPTYSYARIYYNGAVMDPHIDRPSCQYSATLNISNDESGPWGIWFKDFNDKENELFLNPGDTCVYRGDKLEHWRKEYHGNKMIQVFLHYVDSEGEYSDFKFDKRPILGIPKSGGREKYNNFEYV